jgi:hypothetical protein
MTELPPEGARLDGLLKTGSQDHAADAATIGRLQQALSRSLMKGATGGSVAPPELASELTPVGVDSCLSMKSRRRSMLPVCITAACLLIAVLACFAVRDGQKNTIVTNSGTQPRASGAEPRVRLAALWKEAGSLFGSDLRWLGDLDGELLLGINGTREHPSAGSRVYLSLILRVFNSTTGTWENSWTGNFACEGGATVNFASTDQRSTGSIWVQARPDGRFATSHWLNWRDHPELSGSVDTTVSSDQPQVVLERFEEGRRMQVVQQVWRPDVG